MITHTGRPLLITILVVLLAGVCASSALAGLSLGGMLAVEIMQFAADRVTKLALLDTGMRSQSEAERAIRRRRTRDNTA